MAPPPGMPPMGQPPVGAYGAPAGPRSPLPVVAAVLSLIAFVYTLLVTITFLILEIGHTTSSVLVHVSFVPFAGRTGTWFYLAAVAIVAILFLVGGILLLARKPAGRIVPVIAAVATIAVAVSVPIQAHHFVARAAYFIFPIFALIVLVLSVLPATGLALRGAPPAYAPPQPQFGMPPQQPYQQPGYPQPPLPQQPGYPQPPAPQQQPPGGYQQPPGGMPG